MYEITFVDSTFGERLALRVFFANKTGTWNFVAVIEARAIPDASMVRIFVTP